MKKYCLQCNKEFEKPYNESKRAFKHRHKFCSKKCKKDSQKGIIPHSNGFKKGMTPWNKDKKGFYHLGPPSIEHRYKLAISKIGENNPAWCGGMSKPQQYTDDWTDTLKESIKQRDHYECQICGIHQDELAKSLHVHHIDYIKDNCNPTNLIALCPSCHSKTNHNRRQWSEYFNKQSTVA